MIIIIKRPYCMLSLTSKKIACESANLVKTQNETTTYFYLAEKKQEAIAFIKHEENEF